MARRIPVYVTKRGYQIGSMPAVQFKDSSRKPQPRYVFPALRDKIYIRDAGQCQYCGAEVTYHNCNIDHIVPWKLGGRTEASNLVVACTTCNELKGNALIPYELRPDVGPRKPGLSSTPS